MPKGVARPDIAEQVLRHFLENDRAMDSVEGIARFWVNEDHRVVERCLEELSGGGLLQKRTIAGTHYYSLPRASEPNAPLAPHALWTAPEPALASAGRVLVVDDDRSVLTLIADILSDAGHQVTQAANGERALEILRSEPCELVVTDVAMPGMSGMDVLAAVKKVSPDTEVIVVTAYATLEIALLALRQGAYDLITKPLTDLEALDRVVRRALEKRHLSLENRMLLDAAQKRTAELRQTVTRMAAAHEIGRSASALFSLPSLCDSLARLVAQHLNARRVSILLGEPGSASLSVVASVGLSDGSVLGEKVRLGERIAGRVAATLTPVVIEDIRHSRWSAFATPGRYLTPSCLLTPLTLSSPLRRADRQVAVIAASDKHSGDPFTEQDRELLSTISQHVSVALENAHVVREMEDGYLGALVALVQACEEMRPETRNHSRRVVDLAAAAARELRLPEERVQLLLKAASLHEIGRLALGLASPSGRQAAATAGAARPWTPQDVVATDQLLARIPTLREVREIILHSVDRHDAAAPPFEVTRAPIPIESRILSLCEDFSRLEVHAGSGGAAAAQALEALRAGAGRRHDRDVVEALERALEREGRA